MRFVCDAPGGAWFRIETETEAETEAELMSHAVARHFREARAAAVRTFQPASTRFIESGIGLEAHVQREMPQFLTLRDQEGTPAVTAMLPPSGRDAAGARIIIVGPENRDPYPTHRDAIEALGRHFGLSLGRERCYPYRR